MISLDQVPNWVDGVGESMEETCFVDEGAVVSGKGMYYDGWGRASKRGRSKGKVIRRIDI